MNAIELITEERKRQIEKEGWTIEHDDMYDDDQLANAAASYALCHFQRGDFGWESPQFWPFQSKWWKPTPDDRIRELVKSGALIVAEIERLQRKEGIDE